MSCKDMRQPERSMRTVERRVKKGPLKEMQKRVISQTHVNSSKTLCRREPAMVNQSPTRAGRGEESVDGPGNWGRSKRH